MPNTLPSRYEDFRRPFYAAMHQALKQDAAILDVGSGRKPSLPPESRGSCSVYVGLDISEQELLASPQGSYDELVIGDIGHFRPELEGRFDLIISWQVLEHVKPLDKALTNIRSYLKPGGVFVAHLSGGRSVFGLINKLIPHRTAKFALSTLIGRNPETVFPAHYDRCWERALKDIGSSWDSFEVTPRFAGATYFNFAPPLRKAYLAYENWLSEKGMGNLATHYLIVGKR